MELLGPIMGFSIGLATAIGVSWIMWQATRGERQARKDRR